MPEHPPALRPMLAAKVGIPVDGIDRMVEPKWDGVRAIVTVADGRVRLVSRNDHDVTAAYPELAAAPRSLVGRTAVLDAEVAAIDDEGHPSFGQLQRRMHVRHPQAQLMEEVPVSLMVFDVLWLDGRLLTGLPQRARRAELDALGIAEPPWFTSPVLDLSVGPDLLALGREIGLEGFVLKRADAPYSPGRRSDAWVKVKCIRRREFVVAGWLEGRKSRSGDVGSLALGVWASEPRRLIFVGMVGSGLTGSDVKAFRAVMDQLSRRDESVFDNATPPGLKHLDPVLVAEVMFSEVTAAGTLRHPVLHGFRTDVAADDVGFDGEFPDRTG